MCIRDSLTVALCGIRCERLEQAHLVLAARFSDYEPEILNRALQERRTLVRTWGVRGTLQIVPTSQLSLYLAAAGVSAPRWRRFLDARSNLATPARLRHLRRLCPEVISRDALREAIPDATTRLFMLREAAQAGHIVLRDGDGQQATYAWTRVWLEKEVEPDRDYHALVARYLTSYGPLDAADLASWLGVTVAAARRLMAKHLVEEIPVEDQALHSFMRPEDVESLARTRKSRARGLVVVPPGDPLVMAYKTRYRPPDTAAEEIGLAFLDGRPVASWTMSRGAISLQVTEAGLQGRIEKAIHKLLARAGVEAAFEEVQS